MIFKYYKGCITIKFCYCLPFPNKTMQFSMLPLWTVFARQMPIPCPAQSLQTGRGTSLCSFSCLSLPTAQQALLPVEFFFSMTGPFHISCLPVKGRVPGSLLPLLYWLVRRGRCCGLVIAVVIWFSLLVGLLH